MDKLSEEGLPVPMVTDNGQTVSSSRKSSTSDDEVDHEIKVLVNPTEKSDQVNQASPPQSHSEKYVLCIPLYQFSHRTQFTICTIGVLVFFISYGYCQELMFQLPGFRPFGMFLTLIQFFMNTVMGFIERRLKGDTSRRIPLKTHCLISFLSVATTGLSNTSVGYLNYPTHVIFKCCTLIPVMIGGVVIQGKAFNRFDFLASIFMSVGLVFFMLTDSSVSPNFNPIGVTLIMLALLADAGIGNVQEKAMKQHVASVLEVVFFSNAIGSVYLIFLLAGLNQLGPAITFCNQYPVKTYVYACLFSVCGYFGLQMMLVLVRISGAFVAAVVANCRKGLTVIISFTAFEKPFALQYVWSCLIVFLGIYCNLLGKNEELKTWTLNKLQTLNNSLYRIAKFFVWKSHSSTSLQST